MSDFGGRHEIKLYINYADLLQLRTKLKLVTKLDANSASGNGYRVKSLYFDNYNDKALKEKLNGLSSREKFRLRLYDNNTSFIRLEKKSKKSGFCFKEGVPVSEKECHRLLAGDYSVLKENMSNLCLELYAKMHYQQLRPQSIVDYLREAYVYPPGNVRITLDYDIRTSSNIGAFMKNTLIPVPLAKVFILEVKYDHYLPEIIRGLISLASRNSTAFSKYASARII